MFKPSLILILALYLAPGGAHAADCWISPNGRGEKDGRSEENAYAAADGKAQQCWEETGPTETMHVLPGIYSRRNNAFWTLKITEKNSGSDRENPKKLIGQGDVRLEGSRPVPYKVSERDQGETWIRLEKRARNVVIENFDVEKVAYGIDGSAGGYHHLRLTDLHFVDTRQNIYLRGHPACRSQEDCEVDPETISRAIRIEQTSGTRYSKRHIRLSPGIDGVRVFQAFADAQYLDHDFAVGFDVENPSHDILFEEAHARRNLFTGSEYWNGDGFKAEEETYNISYLACTASENADAGFDIKAGHARLVNSVAFLNKRNIRIWSHDTAHLWNIYAAHSRNLGGEGAPAGVWVSGRAECRYCTLRENSIQLMLENNGGQPPFVRLQDSILAVSEAIPDGQFILKEEGARLELDQTLLWKENGPGRNPEFRIQSPEFRMDTALLNSARYGMKKGFHSQRPAPAE